MLISVSLFPFPPSPWLSSRAQMRKGRTDRRTVVKVTGGRKQILLERVDDPKERSQPHDLKQHLHRLIHRYCEEEKDGD